MTKRIGKRAPAPPIQPEMTSVHDGFFPFTRYTSVVGVHTSLLVFTALFLPQTSWTFSEGTSKHDRSALDALTTNPTLTLASICAGTTILQGWWGGWVRLWWAEYSSGGKVVEEIAERAALSKKKHSEIRDAWLATLAGSFIIFILLILFGAPLTSHIPQTYLLACLVSLLVTFSPAYTIGIPALGSNSDALVKRLTWIRLFAEISIRNPVERALAYPAVGAVVGCWVGTFPIPLDWDRPWQAWPLTPAFGAIAGYIIGSLWALTVSATQALAIKHIRSQENHGKKVD